MGDSVVHIVQKFEVGGIETLVLDLMRSETHRDQVISLEGATSRLTQHWPALQPFAARIAGMDKKPGIDWRVVSRVAAHLRSIQPAAVIAHHIGPLLYGGIAARLARVPAILHYEHDVWHYQNPRHVTLLAWCERLLHPHHLAASNEIAARVRTLLPRARVTVAAPGIDLERFQIGDRAAARQAIGLSHQGPLIGTVGRLAAVKGQRHLVEAVALLPGAVALAIVGDGPDRLMLETLARDLKVAPRVHFVGQRDGIEHILPAFDVFCLPSLGEGLPRAVLEAQACGLPVVATDVGDLKSAVCRATGILVPAADPAALARALVTALAMASPDAQSRAFVGSSYTLDRLRGTLREVLTTP